MYEPKRYSEEEILNILKLSAQGRTNLSLANEFGIDRNTIARWIKKAGFNQKYEMLDLESIKVKMSKLQVNQK